MKLENTLRVNSLNNDKKSKLSIETCCICKSNTDLKNSSEHAYIRCNVREFNNNFFTFWRCLNCRSLHCFEEIDFAKYYANYPIRRQKYDFFAKQIFKKRLKILLKAGLKKGDTLLDYGCGSGHFVRFARNFGILAEGYDPYSSEKFSDINVLNKKYDFVVSQDVVEHDENPNGFIKTVR